MSVGLKALKGENSGNINGHASIAITQADKEFGFYLNFLYGIGKSARLTFSAGVFKFNTGNPEKFGQKTTRLFPCQIGYKQNIRKFFIGSRIGACADNI